MFDRTQHANLFLRLTGVLLVVSAIPSGARPAISQELSARVPESSREGSSSTDDSRTLHRWVETRTDGDKESQIALRKARMYGSVEQDTQGQVVAILTCGRWMTDDVAREIGDFRNLTRLHICQSSLVGHGLENLKECRNLEELAVFSRNFSGSNLQYLEPLTNLKCLRLTHCDSPDDAMRHVAMRHVAKLASLERFELLVDQISDVGFQRLGRMQSLTTLRVPRSSPSDAALQSLAPLRSKGLPKKLTTLAFRADHLSAHGFDALRRLTSLRNLHITGGRISEPVVDKLVQLTTLEVLTVRAAQIDSEQMERLKSALPACEVKFVSCRPFRNDGHAELAEPEEDQPPVSGPAEQEKQDPYRGYPSEQEPPQSVRAVPRTPVVGQLSAGKPVQSIEPVRLDGELLAVDRFNGRLGLNWKPVRHDPTHVSLTKNSGLLTITTQRGSIHGDEKNDRAGDGIQAKNLFLIQNPLAANTDFEITLAVWKFRPETHYHQVALLCYNDDDNYLKWSYEHSWREPDTQNFVLVRETDQRPEHDLVLNKSGLNRFWIRVTKEGATYQCAFSTDGKDFEIVGEKTWGDGSPKNLGFLAKNGGNPEAAEIDVCIRSFKVRALSKRLTNE